MYLIVQGLMVGFSIAAPVGAIGFLCIQNTLQGGIVLGVISGLGAATADMLYGVLVAFGLRVSQASLLKYSKILALFGGLFLCYLGIRKIFSIPIMGNAQKINGGLLKAYVITFFLTLTNPATILDFMALFAGLRIDVSGYKDACSFIGGVFLGSILWWLILCCVVGMFRKKISIQCLRYINYCAGLAIFIFGIYAISRAFR